MDFLMTGNIAGLAGIFIHLPQAVDAATASHALCSELHVQDLVPHVATRCGRDAEGAFLHLHLHAIQAQAWAPGHDTLQLCSNMQLTTDREPDDLTREILVAMLIGPVAFEFPSIGELVSAVRIRRNIVLAARKTTLAFDTEAAERPEDCWTYAEDSGFTILPGTSLIKALIKATQPEVSGRLFSFSCYRATEYVTLLGIAQDLETSNPALFAQLQSLWTRRAIKSGEFHEVFLREQGSMEAPLPQRYFVPGDRTWFRNPDEASADVTGYEGSWVMYLGNGLFTNFWKSRQPYTLVHKCLEIYHWRHAVYLDAQGEQHMDEDKVDALVEATRKNPAEVDRILAQMLRYREPQGVYVNGGCIDTTREFARWVHPGTTDLVLPEF